MIGFYLNPKNWFLDKKTKKVAHINYFLDGEERDRALARLEDPVAQHELSLAIELKYGHISNHEYTKRLIAWRKNMQQMTVAEAEISLLENDLAHQQVTQVQYDKRMADIKKEPWVIVASVNLDPKNPGAGFFELDFNEHFVEMLALNGYGGIEADDIVNEWFNDLCKNIVLEDMVDENGNPRSFITDSKDGQIVRRLKTDGDFSEYS